MGLDLVHGALEGGVGPGQPRLGQADTLGHAGEIEGNVRIGQQFEQDLGAFFDPADVGREAPAGVGDAEFRAGRDGVLEVPGEVVELAEQVAEGFGAYATNRLQAGQLGGEKAEFEVVFGAEADQHADGRHGVAAQVGEGVAVVVADFEQAVAAQAAQHGFELDRIEEGKALAQLLGAPARGVGFAADFAQHQEAHQHFGLAAMKQRAEGGQQRPGLEQRGQFGHVVGGDAGGEQFVEADFGHGVSGTGPGP